MLHLIAPFGLADVLARIVGLFPAVFSPAAFGLVVFVYLRVLGGPLTSVLGWLDFFIATNLRRIGASPPGIQHSIAEFIPKLPRLLRRVGLAVLLLGLATQALGVLSEKREGLSAALFEALEFVDGTGSVQAFDQQDVIDWLSKFEGEEERDSF